MKHVAIQGINSIVSAYITPTDVYEHDADIMLSYAP